MKKTLVEKRGNKFLSKSIKIFETPSNIATLSSDLAWKILHALTERPMYPNEIAKKLKVHEQKVYYHINRLHEAGVIQIVSEEEKQGAICRYFALVSNAFGVELPGNESEIRLGEESANPILREFFMEFLKDGFFEGSIVVGSPIEHGPYLTAARDGHYASQLAMFLGSLCKTGSRTVVKLDTEVKAERAEDRNMIVIGGPVTNMITNDINDKLKVKFHWKNNWTLTSSFTKTNFTDEMDAIVIKVKNPWNPDKKIMLLCGVKGEGTKTAILAVTQFYEKLLKGYDHKKDFYAVIRGLDKDGDGKVDDIKILEIQN